MKVLRIITPKYEYVCKWPDKKCLIPDAGKDFIRLDHDICLLHIGRNKEGGMILILEPFIQDPAYRPYIDLGPEHIVAVMELDQNGPFYAQYIKTVSSLIIPSAPNAKISQH